MNFDRLKGDDEQMTSLGFEKSKIEKKKNNKKQKYLELLLLKSWASSPCMQDISKIIWASLLKLDKLLGDDE